MNANYGIVVFCTFLFCFSWLDVAISFPFFFCCCYSWGFVNISMCVVSFFLFPFEAILNVFKKMKAILGPQVFGLRAVSAYCCHRCRIRSHKGYIIQSFYFFIQSTQKYCLVIFLENDTVVYRWSFVCARSCVPGVRATIFTMANVCIV